MLSTVPTVPSRRLKLLVVAPTCDGDDVGEAWVAFQWVRRLAELYDVTLLTYSKRGKRPASEQLPRCRVIEWTEPRMFGRAERFNSLLKPGYLPFYIRARRWIRFCARGRRAVRHRPPDHAGRDALSLTVDRAGDSLRDRARGRQPPDAGSVRVRGHVALVRRAPAVRRLAPSARPPARPGPSTMPRACWASLRTSENCSKTADCNGSR